MNRYLTLLCLHITILIKPTHPLSPGNFENYHVDYPYRAQSSRIRPYTSPYHQQSFNRSPFSSQATHSRQSLIERANGNPVLANSDISLVKLMNEYIKGSNRGSSNFQSASPWGSSFSNRRIGIRPTSSDDDYKRIFNIRDNFSSGSRDPGYNRWGKKYPVNLGLAPTGGTIIYEQRVGAGMGVPGAPGSVPGVPGLVPEETIATVTKIDRNDIGQQDNSLRTGLQSGETTKTSDADRKGRFFNLFNFFNLVHILGKKTSCSTQDGTRGECKLSNQCRMEHGTAVPEAKCTTGLCCIATITQCGLTINRNLTVFEAPTVGDTTAVSTGGSCFLRVAKLAPGVCQLRFDLITLELKPPTNGNCQEDRFMIMGQNANSIVPQLCGTSSGQHVLADVDKVKGPIEVNVVTVGGSFIRRWKIQVTQIKCSSLKGPAQSCLQHHTGTEGSMKSFNYQPITGQYLNNLNYAVCLRKEAGYCSVQYEVPPNANFNLPNLRDGTSTVTGGNAGEGSIDCPGDYIVVSGTRLCGDRFNDGSSPTMTENTIVKDTTNGPFILQFVSDAQTVGEGFFLNYQQLPC